MKKIVYVLLIYQFFSLQLQDPTCRIKTGYINKSIVKDDKNETITPLLSLPLNLFTNYQNTPTLYFAILRLTLLMTDKTLTIINPSSFHLKKSPTLHSTENFQNIFFYQEVLNENPYCKIKHLMVVKVINYIEKDDRPKVEAKSMMVVTIKRMLYRVPSLSKSHLCFISM